MPRAVLIVGLLAVSNLTDAQEASMPAQSAAPAIPARSPRWIQGTDAELMFLREVNSRSAKAGDRIRLRANTPVLVDGVEVIPVGASA